MDVVKHDWTVDAIFFEYSKAADPVGAGYTSQVPAEQFSSDLYKDGPTRIIPLDLSKALKTGYLATSPALLSNFVRINKDEEIQINVNATSQLMYVMCGKGSTDAKGFGRCEWKQGDFLTFPANCSTTHHAHELTIFYLVHDQPLLSYLGVTASEQKFKPTIFTKEKAVAFLEMVSKDPEAAKRSRIATLLSNKKQPHTLTITHVLWAMFGILPMHSVQPPHRHQSVALDLILECNPDCYTLIGDDIDHQGNLKNPKRINWEPNSVFVTPPGKWHSHHNDGDTDAHLVPIQDAGLHTYLRSLDIKFTKFNEPLHPADITATNIDCALHQKMSHQK